MNKVKVIIKPGFGAFEPNEEFRNLLKKKNLNWWSLEGRTDADIISFVEKNSVQGGKSRISVNDWEYLKVVEVDTSIPWTIADYDGAESIKYLNYKIENEELNYFNFL